ncbi:hypothetical protein Y032_1021g3417 [Ancylostoma ceylanicum]|uniref:Uncharacterized protein n=1 Tax=Ancylostoma ceylanicum TaxID=53326 RepID=A0A016W7N0_9BILA|nr:hypothetical protein Y032_1021g3417 [Ancylostoma ceylanicum]
MKRPLDSPAGRSCYSTSLNILIIGVLPTNLALPWPSCGRPFLLTESVSRSRFLKRGDLSEKAEHFLVHAIVTNES